MTKDGNHYFVTTDKHIISSGKFNNVLAYVDKATFEKRFIKEFLPNYVAPPSKKSLRKNQES